MKFTLPTLLLSISLLLLACGNNIDEIELDYIAFDADRDGIIKSIESNRTEVFFSGGNQWLSGWIYRYNPATQELTHIFQDLNQLNALEVNDNNILAGGLSHQMMRIDFGGNLLRSYYIMGGTRITDIVSNEDQVFYTTADNGIQTGNIRRVNEQLRDEQILFESKQGLEDIHLSQNNHLHASGYGIISNCPNLSDCKRSTKNAKHFRAILEIDNGEILAFAHHGKIFSSKNNGIEWIKTGKQIQEFKKEGLIDAIAIDDNTYWTCGYSGLVYFTTDGGKNWTKIKNLPKNDWHAIHYFDGLIYLGGTDGAFLEIPI